MTVEDLPSSGTGADSAVVRVLSYNVRSMRDDTVALARVIRACAPDVVLVQEAPRFFRWRKAAARLARATGLVHVTGGATAAGPMVLSSLRAEVLRTEDVLLPHHPPLHQRGLATAVLRIGGARLAVVSAHLSLSPVERYDQAGLLLDRVAALAEPHVVVGADVNEPPEHPAFTRVTDELQDCFSANPWGGEVTNVRAPFQRVDAVFASERIQVLGCGVPHSVPGVTHADLHAATDHLPVLAALRIPRT